MIYIVSVKWNEVVTLQLICGARDQEIFDKKMFVWFSDGEFEQRGKRITRKDQNVEQKTKDLELFMWQLFSIH